MKNIHPLRTARRQSKRIERLGSDQPICLLCGCSEPMLLRPITRRFAEEHHLLGRANDSILILALCFNCHALVTENLHEAGVRMERERYRKKFAANAFRALAAHHKMLSDAFWRYATFMETEENDEGKVAYRPRPVIPGPTLSYGVAYMETIQRMRARGCARTTGTRRRLAARIGSRHHAADQ